LKPTYALSGQLPTPSELPLMPDPAAELESVVILVGSWNPGVALALDEPP
jgi:hypothetical protein